MPDENSPQAAAHRHRTALPRLAIGALVVLCAAKLLLHLFTSVQHYGYFRDELYYLDLGRHLAFGYVDCAPLVGLYARIALWMGGSLAALRIIPAFAGAALVALTILIARELGGGPYAQLLAGVAALLSPGILVMDNFLSMNAFEPLFWMGCVWALARLLRTGDRRMWIWFGILAGLGIENKHSTVFFLAAVIAALLLTEHRREFLKPWIWLAVAIVLALAAPNLVWQIRRHFPTLEDMQNVRRTHKNVVLGPVDFVVQQIVSIHPILLPVWLTGLIWSLWTRRWRLLGIVFAVFFVVMELMHAKTYYLFPIYPMMLAAGAVAIERWAARWKRPRLATAFRVTALALIVICTGAFLPLDTWKLSPSRWLAYSHALGYKPQKMETNHESLLPQPIADQFGWPEMAAQIAGIYNGLSPAERAQTAIIAGNYGEAGAVDQFGPQYGLPTAISGHQNHWYWGPPPRNYQNYIVIQWDEQDVKDNCASYEGFPHYDQYGMGEENMTIFLCRGAKFDLRKDWPEFKHWN